VRPATPFAAAACRLAADGGVGVNVKDRGALMSHSESITITCPTCQNKQSFTVWQSVNATLDPELKRRLLDRSLITFKCATCGHTAHVEQGLMYQDMDRKLVILRGHGAPEDTLAEAIGPTAAAIEPEYTYRLVGSLNALIEKILIADAGFDDRIVEVVKCLLMGHLDESQRGEDAEFFFSGTYTEAPSEPMIEFNLVNKTGSTTWAVPLAETVQRCEAELRNILPDRESERGTWLWVDQQYARKYVQA
jgi:hypothetical protein